MSNDLQGDERTSMLLREARGWTDSDENAM